MDYETIVSLRDDIKSLKYHIDNVYSLLQDLEYKYDHLNIMFENTIAAQEAEENNHVS